MTTLPDFLRTIAGQLNLDAEALIAYAEEDRVGGFNLDVNQRKWGTGSIWEVEGKALYALVRAMKPRHVVEIGTWLGCGATHILEALAVNKRGKLTSIDIDPAAGRDIPLSLRARWQFVNAAAQDYLETSALSEVDLVFEDASHLLDETVDILSAVKATLKPRLCISHDGMHFLVGADVRAAYVEVWGEEPEALLVSPSDCGFCWQVLAK